jgi:S-methyl-5-thioribose-1-phosphate isomerase
LDQLLLPSQKVYINIETVEDAWSVIRRMQIRGAPLIAIVACLALSVDMHRREADAGELFDKMELLKSSRPTAVNLFNAMNELGHIVSVLVDEADEEVDDLDEIQTVAVKEYAEFALQRDQQDNRNIGKHGAMEILETCGGTDRKLRIMTICNTGSLATSGYGTALGVVRALHERGSLEEVVILETRPYNQGSRLTAFEIMEDNIPGRLICDSMAGAFMTEHKVDAVVVGADRVCANGDTANKIGTYSLSVIAAAHGVPVYVASPITTLDVGLPSGEEVLIEERPAMELLNTSQAPPNIPVWNPSFDITPFRFIKGIITEKGVIKPKADQSIEVDTFVLMNATSDNLKALAASSIVDRTGEEDLKRRRYL